MAESKPPSGASLYRGPAGVPRDKRQRERDRAREAEGGPREERPAAPPRAERADRPFTRHEKPEGGDRPPRRPHGDKPAARGPRHEAPPSRGPRHEARPAHAPKPHHAARPHHAPPAARIHEPHYDADADTGPRAAREQRIYGLNACLALFAARPEAIRKVWLLESRIPKLKAVLAWCVQQRLGYTLVQDEDLEKLSGSAHHEGVCFSALPATELTLAQWLHELPAGPAVALWLDGVGNPHNLGAVLRSAAHFGAAAVLLPQQSELALSGAAARVAEGGAEHVALVRLGRADNAMAQLQAAGFALAATVVRGGTSLHAARLPARVAWVLGAEQVGVAADMAQSANLRIGIPGTGAVDSLNVAAAAAVLLAEWRRQHAVTPSHR